MKISQEARDAAAEYLGTGGVNKLLFGDGMIAEVQSGKHDGTEIVQAFQSLINSTLERAAKVADALEMEMDAEFESGGEQEVGGMSLGARVIALDIRKMMES